MLHIDKDNNSAIAVGMLCNIKQRQTQSGKSFTTTHEITYQGETHTIAEWARITGISENALYNRVNRNWDLDRIFSQKVRGSRV